jgi:hypothetical protein
VLWIREHCTDFPDKPSKGVFCMSEDLLIELDAKTTKRMFNKIDRSRLWGNYCFDRDWKEKKPYLTSGVLQELIYAYYKEGKSSFKKLLKVTNTTQAVWEKDTKNLYRDSFATGFFQRAFERYGVEVIKKVKGY